MAETTLPPDAALDDRLRHVEESVVRLETRFETELPHLATKEALAQTELRLIKWAIGIGITAVVVLSAQLWGAVQILLRSHL